MLELVRLFAEDPVVRLRIVGTIAAGEPIEALTGAGEVVEVHAPLRVALRHRDVLRRYLCPALDRATGDAFELARIITPLLAGLKVSGKVPIDLDPWLFAGVSLLITRTGVAAFCGEERGDEGEESVHKGTDIEGKGGGDTSATSGATVASMAAGAVAADASTGVPVPKGGSIVRPARTRSAGAHGREAGAIGLRSPP